MRTPFYRHRRQKAALDQIEREAVAMHRENVDKIVSTREKVDTLNIVLKQNNIVFQLAHVIGFKK